MLCLPQSLGSLYEVRTEKKQEQGSAITSWLHGLVDAIYGRWWRGLIEDC